MRGRWAGTVGVGVVLLGLGGWWWTRYSAGKRFDGQIRHAAARYGVDPTLVKAVIWKESRFRPAARGQAGEIGLMQLRELAAVEWSSAERVLSFEMEHLLDPETNTLAGTWYLARLLRRYEHTDNPVPYALADYNAGRRHVLNWIRDHPGAGTNAASFVMAIGFPGTRRYVESILRKQEEYRVRF